MSTITGTATARPDTTMIEPMAGRAAVLRLLAWLSPAFPVGSFSYSHGLERAAPDGAVADEADLRAWIEALLRHGSGWNDAVLLAESWRRTRTGGDLAELAALAEALAGSRERHMESLSQGTAFLKAAASWPADATAKLPPDCAYCVAVGTLAGAHGVALPDALGAFLQAFASNLLQAGIRLGIIGQQSAVAVVCALEPVVLDVSECAARSSLDDLGSCTVFSDVMAMRHEVQYSRLFRS